MHLSFHLIFVPCCLTTTVVEERTQQILHCFVLIVGGEEGEDVVPYVQYSTLRFFLLGKNHLLQHSTYGVAIYWHTNKIVGINVHPRVSLGLSHLLLLSPLTSGFLRVSSLFYVLILVFISIFLFSFVFLFSIYFSFPFISSF